MKNHVFTLLLSIAFSVLSLPATALPNLGLGPFGPGVQDGAAPFNIDGNCTSSVEKAESGDDCGEYNQQVRTQDTVVFNWSITADNYTLGQDNPKNVVFEQLLKRSAQAVVEFARIPVVCTENGGGGSNPISNIVTEANGDLRLICNLGEFREGMQRSFSTVAKVKGDSWNGSYFHSQQRVYSNADNGAANATTAVYPEIGPIDISSRPRVDLSSGIFHGYRLEGARDVGYGLESGYYTWLNMRVATDHKTGNEALAQPFTFGFNLSATKNSSAGPDYTNSGFEFYMVDCKRNPYGIWAGEVFGAESVNANYPIHRKVENSGTCAFSREDAANPSSPYKMSIQGANFLGDRYPTEAGGGMDLKAGPYFYINMAAQFFIPMRVIDNVDGTLNGSGGLYLKSVLTDFDPTGMSGTPNFNGAKEPGYNGQPMPDGSVSNNIAPAYHYFLKTQGSWANYAFKTNKDTGTNYTIFHRSGTHSGLGLRAPTQAYANSLHFTNTGSNDLHDPRACVAFDNTVQKLTDRGDSGATPGTYAYVGSYSVNGYDFTNYIVEYGRFDASGDDPLAYGYNDQTGRYKGNWNKQGRVRCDDSLTDWKADPHQVLGGIDAVNIVRMRLKDSVKDHVAFSSKQSIRFITPLEVRQNFYGGPHAGQEIPVGTVAANFGSIRSDEYFANWSPGIGTRPYNPAPESINYVDGDRITVAKTASRLDSSSLLPSARAATTGSTIAGKPVVWKVVTSIQSLASDAPEEHNVQIIDELPPEVAYNQSCTASYADAQGKLIGTPADLVQYNTDRDGHSKTGYTRLIWNLGTVKANTAIPARVICTDSDPMVKDGTVAINYAEIRGDTLLSSLSSRSDTHSVVLEQIGSIQVSKQVESTLDDVNAEQHYTLTWANFAASFAIDPTTIIDVFPYNGDSHANNARAPASAFSGRLELLGTPSVTWMGGQTDGAPLGTWYYTTDTPNTINHNPDQNTSNWLTEAQLSGDFSQVTAVKFVGAYPLEKNGDPHQGMQATYSLRAGDVANPSSANANLPNNRYANLFTLDTASLPPEQFLKSNTTVVEVASYTVGDLIFADLDGDLKYTASVDIPAPNGVKVVLYKASDNSQVASTQTGIEGQGRYVFNNVKSGDYYVVIPASEFVVGAVLYGWDSLVTVAASDDDLNESDDQDGYKTAAVTSVGVRTNRFTLSADDPLPGGAAQGKEPLQDNTASLNIQGGDDFTNLTLDIALKAALDFGDAPDSYGRAGHGVSAIPDLYLGSLAPDTELQPQNTAQGGKDGLGDEQNLRSDEDSLTASQAPSTTDTRYPLTLAVHNKTSTEATLVAWVDFDQSGTFEASEGQLASVAAGFEGSPTLVWNSLPVGTFKPGPLWVRVRLSTDSKLTLENATGAVFDGEVEDFMLTVQAGRDVSGRVFIDRNADALNDATEAGIARNTLVLFDSVNKTCRSQRTDASGHYLFSKVPAGDYQLYQAWGEAIPVPKRCNPALAKSPAGYQSTTPDVLSFEVAASDLTDKDFGESRGPVFVPHHQSAILPGNVAFYAHRFATPTAGKVRFVTQADLNTAVGWSHRLYRDNNCDGVLVGSEAAAVVDGLNFGVASGTQFCLINKVFAPANVPIGDRYRVITRAELSYSNNMPSTVLQVKDVITAGGKSSPSLPATVKTPVTPVQGASRLQLRKSVQNTSQGTSETKTMNQAKPGDFLTYRIYYRNTGSGPISELMLNDTVPDFTHYVLESATCQQPPAGLSCSPSINGPHLKWVFTGTLQGGAQGVVSYDVMVDQ